MTEIDVRVAVLWDEEFGCYDVMVLDAAATVGEFEERCRRVLAGEQIRRKYSDSCIGCSICCSERIPVTLCDVLRIVGERSGDVLGVARGLVEVESYGRCADVKLRVDDLGICRFWQKDRGRCSIYEKRPFACSTYVCAPVSWRFEELRSQVINRGQDDLVSFLFEERSDPSFAMSYHEIRIKDICTKRLWRALLRR